MLPYRKPEETPIARVQRLRRSTQFAALSQDMQRHIRRITDKLHAPMIEILDREEAAFRICRHVAWGAYLQDRTLRLALALYLRAETDLRLPGRSTTGWSWPKDRPVAAAERCFRKSAAYHQLVRQGSLLAAKQIPTPLETANYLQSWKLHWEAIHSAFERLDKNAFLHEVKVATAPKSKRNSRAKKKPLTAEQSALRDALRIVERALLRGDHIPTDHEARS